MKASELMIGDWVMYYKEPKQITYIYARPLPDGTNPSNEVGWGHNEECWVNARNIQPIPLTEEILKANGFEKDSPCNYKLPYNDSLAERGFYLENRVRGMYMITDHQLMPILYVHELQRVLRCCGLWNLADNFKVE